MLDIPIAFLRLSNSTQHFSPQARFPPHFSESRWTTHFAISSSLRLLDERFEISALNALETKERVIERTIEMVFADIAPK